MHAGICIAARKSDVEANISEKIYANQRDYDSLELSGRDDNEVGNLGTGIFRRITTL